MHRGIQSQRLTDEGSRGRQRAQELRLRRYLCPLGAEFVPDCLLLLREDRQQERDPEQGDGGGLKASRHHCADLIDDHLHWKVAAADLVTRRTQQIEKIARFVALSERRAVLQERNRPASPPLAERAAHRWLRDAASEQQEKEVAP